MVADQLPVVPFPKTAFPIFLFDSELRAAFEPADGAAWPAAVFETLRSCVGAALSARRETFEPWNSGIVWRIVRLRGERAGCVAVFIERAGSGGPSRGPAPCC